MRRKKGGAALVMVLMGLALVLILTRRWSGSSTRESVAPEETLPPAAAQEQTAPAEEPAQPAEPEHRHVWDGESGICLSCGYACPHERHDAETTVCLQCGVLCRHHFGTAALCDGCGMAAPLYTEDLPERYFAPAEHPGQVQHKTVTDDNGAEHRIAVWLPYDYNANGKYNLLLAIHGDNGSCDDWMEKEKTTARGTLQMRWLYDHLTEERLCEPFIVVSMDNTGMEDPAYNEADAAARIARHLGTEHTELRISEKDAKSVIPLLPEMFAEPFADSSQIPTYLVSRLTRQYVTVSLSGDAGDELFCGYTTYASAERVWRRCQRIPRLLRRAGGGLVLHSPLRRFHALAVESRLLAADCPEDIYRLSFRTDERTAGIALEHPGYPYAYTVTSRDELGEVNRDIMLMDADMYLPDDILVKVDRTSMAVSLESRVPMLDRDVCEFAWALPIGYLRAEHPSRADGTVDARGNRLGKLVLRDILYRYVPRELVDQPKKGFAVPLARWLREPELRQWAEALLSPERIRREGYLDAEVVSSLWNEYTESGVWRAQIWYILMFEAWLESVRR